MSNYNITFCGEIIIKKRSVLSAKEEQNKKRYLIFSYGMVQIEAQVVETGLGLGYIDFPFTGGRWGGGLSFYLENASI